MIYTLLSPHQIEQARAEAERWRERGRKAKLNGDARHPPEASGMAVTAWLLGYDETEKPDGGS